MTYYTKDEIVLMDEWGQIWSSVLDDAFDALNGLSELVWNDLIEEYISYKLDIESAKILGKERKYTGLYGSWNGWIIQLIRYWNDWILVKDIKHSGRILEKLRKDFRCNNVDIELFIMANIIRSGWAIEIIEELKTKRTPDFRFRFNAEDKWIYGEITKRWNSTWVYAEERAEELIWILSQNISGKEGTLAINKVLWNEDFNKLKEWLITNPSSMSEFENTALFYTNDHWVNTMNISLEYIKLPFFIRSWSSVGNNNFIRINAPYIDGGVPKILENKSSQLCKDEKNILFIDITQSIWFEWKINIEEAFLEEKYSHISAIILLRRGSNIQTEILIIQNINAINVIHNSTLEKVSKPYKLI